MKFTKIFRSVLICFAAGLFLYSNSLFADYRSDLASLSKEDRQWVESTCEGMRVYGPSSYIGCVNREISAIRQDQSSSKSVNSPSSDLVTALKAAGVVKENPTSSELAEKQISNTNELQMTNPSIPIVGQKDLGIDSITVTVPIANIREFPDKSSNVLLKVEKGTVAVLLDRVARYGWLNVLDINTSIDGWIHESTVKISLSTNPNQESIFQSEKLSYDTEPELSINNASNRSIKLKVDSQLIEIPPNSSKDVHITSGTYKYYASAPGVIPAMGSQAFLKSHRYTWEFWIERSYGQKTRRSR